MERVERIVLTGGPSSGKSSVLEELKKRGHQVIPESARIALKKLGNPTTRKEKIKLEYLMYNLQDSLEDSCEGRVFQDRSQIDNIAYMKHLFGAPLEGTQYPEFRYDKIFLLERLPFIQDGIREESNESEAQLMHDLVAREYESQGYELIFVPTFPSRTMEESIKRRTDFILSNL